MQYLCNQWSDFTKSWSCLILTLLWIQWYTMYPPHFNYAITLPRKTITMKITIFHRGIFLVTPDNDDEWPPNSPDLNPLDYHVWELCLNATRHFNPSQIPVTSWRMSCKQYSQNSINKAVLSFIKRLRACVKAGGRHFEHVFK